MEKIKFTLSPYLIILFILFLLTPAYLFATPSDDHDGFETSGLIQSIGKDSLVVNSKTFFVDSTTEIRNQLHSVLSFNDLHVGDKVEIMYVKRSDSTNFAKRIMLKTEDNEFEISGAVQSVGGDSLVVHNMVFHTDSTTIIRGEHDSTLTLSMIKVNDLVEIHAVVRPDKTFLATKIKLETEREAEDSKIELEGIIEVKNADTLSVSGTKVTVNTQTEIFGDDHKLLTYSDLAVGMKVEVKAKIQPDSSYLALRIKVEAPEQKQIEITAPIDSIMTSSIIVAGITFSTDSTTEIKDSHGTLLTFNDLKKGMIVEVKGVKLLDGTYHARRIRIKDFWRPKIEVTGIIDTVGSDFIVVTNKRYYVDSQTKIYDSTNVSVTFASLLVGQRVEIHAIMRSDSTLLAKRIKMIGAHETDISGAITAISGDTLTVSGLKVIVSAHTVYFNEADSAVALSDLKVNMKVEIKALLQNNGSYLALIISIEDDPDISQTTGIVSSVTSNSITVSAPNYQITASTVVLDANFKPISSTSLSAGQQVTIWSSLSSSQPTALQIQTSAAVVTDVKNNTSTLPKEYKLSQNYPNPFNPSTNIRYTLPQQGLVTLRVYDILGREVATLVNEVKPAGTYVVRFDAGQLASGVYLYRIESGNFISTKKLVLLK